MGHQQEGDADIALQVLQFDLHLAAQLAVERGEWLIEQQHGRPVDERPRQRHALLLAAGQFLDCGGCRSRSGAPCSSASSTALAISAADGRGLRCRRP